jgi:Formamidopyrimidine-DNA glycosylase
LRLIEEAEKEKAQAYLTFDNGQSIGIFGIMSNGFLNYHKTKNIKDVDEIKQLGVDVLSEDFNIKKFKEILNEFKNKSIKDILLDQSIIAGLGNAYSDEILFESKIHPKRKAKDLTDKEIGTIYKKIFEVLNKAKNTEEQASYLSSTLMGLKGIFMNILWSTKKKVRTVLFAEIQ